MAGQSPKNDSSPAPGCEPLSDASHHGGFSSLDVARVRQTLASLHDQVAFGCGRVEIKHPESDHVCVMISKDELEALETALEILTDTAEYRAMCQHLSQVAAAAGGYV